MIRIGIVAPEFPPNVGGMERLAYGLAQALGETDEVTVYTPRHLDAAPAGRFRQERALNGTLRADRSLLRAITVDAWLGLNGGLVPLLAEIAEPRFVYLHGNDFLAPWLGYASWWLEPLKRPYMKAVRHSIRCRALRAFAPSITHYFTNSRKTADLAENRLRLDGGRITVCPPGVDETFFTTQRMAQDGPLRLITVARMTKYSRRKNVDGVIRALASIRPACDFAYTVVGDGDDRPRLEKLASRLGIGERVVFTGTLTDDELKRRYGASDLFVLASLASDLDVEGFGIVYVEANAAGLPVLASRAGGAVDAVSDGVSGILIADSSPETIAEGILRFARERDRFVESAVRDWAALHRWPEIAKRLRSTMIRHLDAQRGPA